MISHGLIVLKLQCVSESPGDGHPSLRGVESEFLHFSHGADGADLQTLLGSDDLTSLVSQVGTPPSACQQTPPTPAQHLSQR